MYTTCLRAIFASLLIGGGVIARGAGAAEFTDNRGWLHLNGYSYHFDATDVNDKLLGLGFTWYDKRFGSPVTAWTGDVFQDSDRKLSAFLGRSWTFPFRLASVGISGGLMYHRNFATQNRLKLLPVALPYLETRGNVLKLRLYYIPPVRNHSDHQVALQLVTPVWR